ncbi:amidohydrolase [Haladaptatus sp. GCM10025707]|uniref:amidohydrolase n=1 Tax=unclassified Haladaptatus TaxID=2622732 RepID=UPI0023E7A585|nr:MULTISPECIES: amidohydrolase [unclassified Haladaptatus]
MTAAADLILTNGAVHTLTDPDETADGVAIRDGRIVRVDRAYELDFLTGTETEVVDLDGRVVLPGFIDAHTHLNMVGRRLVHADLAEADGPADCIDLLSESARDAGWILGYGYDESEWDESRYLTREDLDEVSTDRPVAAFREDLHVASLNSVALDQFLSAMPDEDVLAEDGEPTGVVVESALDVIFEATEPDAAEMHDLLTAAQHHANALGVTGVHDMVRNSTAPGVFRDLELADELTLRVRLNYWTDHLDAAIETGLRTNHGSDLVRTGAIKSYTDGSFGGRTAKLSESYADGDSTGQWVVEPEELGTNVKLANRAGFQFCAHAIGDDAISAVLNAYEELTEDPGGARHRVEHAELLSDEHIDRFADLGVVASVQPNFLRWAHEGGLYDSRLGEERRRQTNRYADLLEAGVPLAFGSDCMPLNPLFGVHQAVNAPDPAQRLSVTEALRAYTIGSAYAGFDEDRLGTVENGKWADLVVLDESPWEFPEAIEDIDVTMTIVDGEVVYDDR